MMARCCIQLVILLVLVAATGWAQEFKAGAARREITPKEPMPMWGYGARHAQHATGAKKPLFAKALVLDGGNGKVALVGLDLGRGPTYAMMEQINAAVKEQSGVDYVLAIGSHTHHGPAIELLDKPGLGQGAQDYAVKYAQELPKILIELINEAAAKVVPAKIGVAMEETDLNRNRHSRKDPKPRDPRLSVLRVDDMNGNPIAIAANLAAHSTTEDVFDKRWSPDWSGYMQDRVEGAMNTTCLFLQGATGDLSPNTNDSRRGADGFGNATGDKVIEMAKAIQTAAPTKPSVVGTRWEMSGPTRIDLQHPMVQGVLKLGFFPEMIAMLEEIPNNQITVKGTTVLVNGDLALAGASGELFCDLSNRIKAQSPIKNTLVFGYCNGHCMYIPTREGVAEGGYGAEPTMAWVPVGTGEKVVEQVVADITALVKP